MLSQYPVVLTANEVAEVLYEMDRLGNLPGEGKAIPAGKVSP